MTCKSCKWREPRYVDDRTLTGACRRNPPLLMGFYAVPDALSGYRGIWPLVRDNDFCGEHAPRKHATGGEG